jgi:hypothetical protein
VPRQSANGACPTITNSGINAATMTIGTTMVGTTIWQELAYAHTVSNTYRWRAVPVPVPTCDGVHKCQLATRRQRQPLLRLLRHGRRRVARRERATGNLLRRTESTTRHIKVQQKSCNARVVAIQNDACPSQS